MGASIFNQRLPWLQGKTLGLPKLVTIANIYAPGISGIQ